jgi:hypothetical protein
MANNNGKDIKGYRNLTDEEISVMNGCKELAIEVGNLCDELSAMEETDKRWLEVGKTDLQKGFMSIIRSIAKPETF